MATYYVSTAGNDGNAGTIGSPWLTWQKGFATAVAGDIVYIRGGIYHVSGPNGGYYRGVSKNAGVGTASNPISIFAYPGETPILDGTTMVANATHNGMYISNSSYYHLKGLTIRYFTEYGQVPGCPLAHGVVLYNCNHMTLELCNVVGCGRGFVLDGTTDYTYFLNCDAYNNEDFADDGGYADGFGNNLYGATHACHTTFEGCRAWNNSDDGWDFYSSDGTYRGGYATLNNCWSFGNGYRNGDGVGFKLGQTYSPKETGVQRIVTNCIAANNFLFGFDEGGGIDGFIDQVFYNNTSFNNRVGFYINYSDGGADIILRNNIAYGNTYNTSIRSGVVHDHNSWNSGYSVSSADFENLDASYLDDARQSDGSLPSLNGFLHLVYGSNLKYTGINVNLTYDAEGNAYHVPPSLGPFEYSSIVTPKTYYVATNGSNSNPGTSALPFLTIQKGADEAVAGDIVIVKDGTYTSAEDWLVLLQTSGSVGNPITFRSENKYGAILDGQNSRDYGLLLYGGIDYINIEGFEIKNMLFFAITANNSNVTSSVNISGCKIHHIGRVCDSAAYGRSGMYLSNISSWIIEDCIFHDIGRLAAGESGCSPSNEYYKNHDHGIYVDGANGLIIRNNVFYNCNRGWALHFYPDPCSNISIFNNTFDYGNMYSSYGSYGSHIIIACDFSNSYIKNNLFSRDYDYAIFRSSGTFSGIQIYNNLSYGGDGNLMYGSTSGITFSNNLADTNPLMTDDANYDFTLTSASPAINAGVDVGLPYFGSAPDLGAFEYNSVPSLEAELNFIEVNGSFSEITDGVWGYGAGYGRSGMYIRNNDEGYIVANFTGISNYNVVIGLDSSNSLINYSSFAYALYVNSDGNYRCIVNNSYIDLGIPAVIGDRFRLYRVTDTVKAQYYRGGTWTDLYTFPTTSTSDLFLHGAIAITSKNLSYPMSFGAFLYSGGTPPVPIKGEKRLTTISIIGATTVVLSDKPSWITIENNADESEINIGDTITHGMVLAIYPNTENGGSYRAGLVILQDNMPSPNTKEITVSQDGK